MELWLDVPAMAERLGVKRSAVRKAITRGVLVATKWPDGKWRATESEVDRYAAEHRRTS